MTLREAQIDALDAACVAFTGPLEGNILWPYRDNAKAGNASVGRGHLLAIPSYAAAVFGVSLDDLNPQWNDLMACEPGQPAAFYETATDLRITPAKSDELFAQDIAAARAYCQRVVLGFPFWPQPVQVACVDIDYNVAGGIRTFPQMLAAMRAGEWETAAAESNRPQLPARSIETAALIRSAIAEAVQAVS